MGKSERHVLSQNPVTNNCPECFNQDLTLTFYQKHLISRFFDRVTSEVNQELQCNTCGSLLYPIRWTPDIERSVEYYQKALQPEKARIRFRPLFFILIFSGIVLLAALLYFLMPAAS